MIEPLAHAPPLCPAPTLSPAVLALGRRLADTYARHPLTPEARERISQAYAKLCHTSRTLIHHGVNAQGEPQSVVVFDCFLWVIESGKPWCFRLPPLRSGLRRQMSDVAPYVQRFEEFLMGGKGLTLERGPWFLSSFSAAAREVAARWMNQDLKIAFRLAGVEGGAEHDCNWAQEGAAKVRMIKGRSQNRPYLMRIVGAALREVRSALDREVRRTLWSIGVHDARVARWLLEAPHAQALTWRTQALKLHRIGVPVLLDQQFQVQGAPSDFWTAPVHAFSACVDAGQPLMAALAQGLNAPAIEDEDSFRLAFHSIFQDNANATCVTVLFWTVDHVRTLAARPRGLNVGHIRQMPFSDLLRMIDMARFMAPQRKLQKKTHWHRLNFWSQRLMGWGFVPHNGLESFLKGCPLDWDDSFYDQLSNQVAMVDDALRMMAHPKLQIALLQTLNWRQMVNLAHRVHAIEREHVKRVNDEVALGTAQRSVSFQQLQQGWGQVCCWSPAAPADWLFKGCVVHELTSLAQTEEEGQRMEHCVGNGHYAVEAMHGRCRLFSIRNQSTGRSLSTFELRHRPRGAPEVRQHFGRDDRAPAPLAKAVLEAWLRQKICDRGPWEPHHQAIAHHAEMNRQQEVWRRLYAQKIKNSQAQLKQAFLDEVGRRHPKVLTKIT
jgi:hypothetical protein